MEKFYCKKTVGGWITVPADPTNHPLLSRLHRDEGEGLRVTRPLPWENLEDGIDLIRSVADRLRIGVRVCGNIKASPTVLLWDIAAKERAGEVNLRPWLEKLSIPMDAFWLRDGRIVFSSTKPGKSEGKVKRDRSLSDEENAERAARHLAKRWPNPESTYFSLEDFLEKQGDENPWQYGRALYKDTGCGPWVTFVTPKSRNGRNSVYYEDEQASEDKDEQDWWSSCTGIEIGSIVEGSDVEVGPECLAFPFTEDDLDRTVKGIDSEASFYWERDNSTYYTVCNKDGEAEMWCQWTQFEEAPTGNFDEGDKEALELATKAGQTLFEVGSPDYETMIPIPGTEFFVREEPTPDFTY